MNPQDHSYLTCEMCSKLASITRPFVKWNMLSLLNVNGGPLLAIKLLANMSSPTFDPCNLWNHHFWPFCVDCSGPHQRPFLFLLI